MLEELMKTLIHAGPLGVIIGLLILHIRELNAQVRELHSVALKAAEDHGKIQRDEKNARIKDAQDSTLVLVKVQTDYRDAVHKLADAAQVLARRDEDLDREARDMVRGSLGGEARGPTRRGSNG
jgi:uncharacterized membrane-anchored protein YhcB (DUF1043 family)